MSKQSISRIVCLLAVIFGSVLLVSCLSTPLTASEVEDEIYKLVNEERQGIGVTSLARDPDLDGLARQFSVSKLSKDVEQSTELHYLLHNSWRTNYVGGSPKLVKGTAREQVDYCLETAGLREAMLRSEARATGLGVAIVGDTVYYTQVFDVLNAASGNGEPIRLYENAQAVDPLWQELKGFLEGDDTDEHPYIPDSFVCADFAAMVHNRAESAGIRSAYVSVDFVEGPAHALNAFNTVDRGLVYIDCTGQGFRQVTSKDPLDSKDGSVDYDKVAYIDIGHDYGLITLDVATSFDYAFYEQWTQQWADFEEKTVLYKQKCDEYDRAVGGRTVISDPAEYARLKKMFDELENLRIELETLKGMLGAYNWEPLGIVTSIYIHW